MIYQSVLEKKDLWMANLIIVYNKRRNVTDTSGLYDYPFIAVCKDSYVVYAWNDIVKMTLQNDVTKWRSSPSNTSRRYYFSE